MEQLGWLTEPTTAALRAAVAELLPDLRSAPVEWRRARQSPGPGASRAIAVLGGRYVAKVASAERDADAIYREGRVLQVLHDVGIGLPVPRALAVGRNPALVVTSLVPGVPLTGHHPSVAEPSGRRRVGRELGRHLAALHSDPVTEAIAAASLDTFRPLPQAETDALRQRFVPLVPQLRRPLVEAWCVWTDDVLARPWARRSFVHGDLHGHNELWDLDGGTLLALIDLEESGLADPHFDFRYLPAEAPGLELLTGAIESYDECTGWTLDVHRIMAWHIRTCLGDALWRTEADIALPDGGTIPEWIDSLSHRLSEFDIGVD